MNKDSLTRIAIIVLFVLFSVLIIAYARGVRFDLKNKKIQSTGLLVATSNPDGASVYLDDHLTTATNNTINLPPGDYRVKIVKEGYLAWQKLLKIQKEIVTKTDATLFPSTPELRPLTVNGALNPSLSPDGSKIVYTVKSNPDFTGIDQDRSGLYILDMFDRPLSLTRSTRRIAKNIPGFDFSDAKIVWSPDSKSLLILFLISPLKNINTNNSGDNNVDVNNVASAFTVSSDQENQPNDVTATLSLLLKEWQTDQETKYEDQLAILPKDFLKVATQSASLLKFSPDETKIVYEATQSAQLPIVINPPLIGTNTQPEERNLKSGEVYVYDIKEDKNFRITLTPHDTLLSDLIWFPDSRHFIHAEKDAISIIEYDMTNKMTVYAGPFEDSYIFPWPNSSKLVILTTYNKSSSEIPNLYSLGLR